MKKQQLVTDDTHDAFTNKVNGLMSAGWRAVPGTLVMSVSTAEHTNLAGSSWVESFTLYGIVLEEP